MKESTFKATGCFAFIAWLIYVAIFLAVVVGLAIVAIHFISKFW